MSNSRVEEILEEKIGQAGETALKEDAAPRSKRGKVMGAALLVVLVAIAGAWYLYAAGFESTDDAQIDGHINSVSSRVAGTVEKIFVDDNQIVQAGEPLADLDIRELKIAVDQSAAQYAQAEAGLESARPNETIALNTNAAQIAMAESQRTNAQAALDAADHDVKSAMSRLAEAQANAKRDQAQGERTKRLFAKEEISRQEFENATASAEASAARLAAAEAGLASAQKAVDQRKAELDSQNAHLAEVRKNAPQTLAVRIASTATQRANVDLARAQQASAELNLSYAHIVAPVAGVITERAAEVGNRIQPGEQLFMVVDTSNLWVTANFKETQLRKMHAGCKAKVKVDALGRTYEGVVEAMPAITGARASVLPPENATGNYVKVVQRLPVRIALNPGQPQMNLLRPGMSVEAKVELQ